jgi:ribosomal protein L12E/L44/L45/RPP1/RPP2
MRWWSRRFAVSVAGLLVSSVPGFAQDTTAAAPGTSSSLGVPVALPPAYESTISALSALATSGATALKTNRANARALIIRTALTKKLLASGSSLTSIVLDKDDKDPALGDLALLCTPRQNYVINSVSLNYLNTLVQNINAVSAKAAAPTDITGAIKLLLATSNYAIADKVKVDPQTIDGLSAATLANCKADLSSYDQDYYGAAIRTGTPITTSSAAPAAALSVTTFAFLGPVGTLIDTFLSILQPVLIDASVVVDETRRQAAIATALSDPDIENKIATTGKQLATALSAYAAASRHTQAALFVEELTTIRETSIDLSGVADCKNLAPDNRLPSGAPNAAFVGCWRAAWAKLQPMVATLTSTGDNYDNLADPSGSADPQKLLSTILADYAKIKAGATAPANLAIFASDVTQFITLANAIATATSSSNIATLQRAAAAASK